LSCGGIAEEVMTVTLAVEDLTTLAVNKVVDARGTSCPGPILAAKRGSST
jgi:hypothetical protein